eukprot:16444604-Heterocapsa_arctica.AAC.1
MWATITSPNMAPKHDSGGPSWTRRCSSFCAKHGRMRRSLSSNSTNCRMRWSLSSDSARRLVCECSVCADS